MILSHLKHLHCAARKGFTLLEVALATFITVGLLLVVLFFYRQTEQLRQELILETEQISAARMIMTRISSELRSLYIHDPLHVGLMGGSNHIEFVMATPPSRINWRQDDLGRVIQPQSDLRLVSYELAGPGDPSEATGLARSETAVPEFTPLDAEEEDVENASAVVDRELITEGIRHLQFRFWDGAEWVGTWTSLKPPLGVEVTLGGPPMPAPTLVTESLTTSLESSYPFEQFKRVISLAMRATSGDPESEEDDESEESETDESASDDTSSESDMPVDTSTPEEGVGTALTP